jgi:hypothetical protein
VFLADGALMRPQAPALEKRGDAVHPREWDVGGLGRCPRHSDATAEALASDVGVALPAIGVDQAGPAPQQPEAALRQALKDSPGKPRAFRRLVEAVETTVP